MSIIQEALKKVQAGDAVKSKPMPIIVPEPKIKSGPSDQARNLPENAGPSATNNNFKITLLSVLVLALLGIIFHDSIFNKPSINKKSFSSFSGNAPIYSNPHSNQPARKTVAPVTNYEPKKTLAESITNITESMQIGQQQKYVLSGIMALEDGPRAVINDMIVAEGDSVAGARITRIGRKNVFLEYNGNVIVLELK